MIGKRCLALLLAFAPYAYAQPAVQLPAQEIACMEGARTAARSYKLRLSEQLTRSDDARELALAAMLRLVAMWSPSDPDKIGYEPSQAIVHDAQISKWQRAAVASAGSDVIAHVLLMAAVSALEDADIKALATEQWRRLEPGNIAPLLHMDLPAASLLSQVGDVERFDTHHYDTMRWMVQVFERHPPTADETAALLSDADGASWQEASAIMGSGLLLATAMPASRM